MENHSFLSGLSEKFDLRCHVVIAILTLFSEAPEM